MMMMIDHDVVANYTCTHNETKNGGKKERKSGGGEGVSCSDEKKKQYQLLRRMQVRKTSDLSELEA